jgi:hypothetical protein
MGWVVNARPRPLYPRERHPLSLVWEAAWDPSPVLTGSENFAFTGNRSPHRPARSKSLYRMSYEVLVHGHNFYNYLENNQKHLINIAYLITQPLSTHVTGPQLSCRSLAEHACCWNSGYAYTAAVVTQSQTSHSQCHHC